jgi:hypothetical protein
VEIDAMHHDIAVRDFPWLSAARRAMRRNGNAIPWFKSLIFMRIAGEIRSPVIFLDRESDFVIPAILQRTKGLFIIHRIGWRGLPPPHVSSTLLQEWIKPEPCVWAFFRVKSSPATSFGLLRAGKFL